MNATGMPADELGKEIIKATRLISIMESDNTPENISRKENLTELLNSLDDFVRTKEEEENSEETSNKEKESKFPIWPFILIGILVLGGAAAVTVILIRKKQTNQNNDEDQI